MKRIIPILLCALLLAVPVTASNEVTLVMAGYPVLVNELPLQSDKPILNLNGTTYIPLKAVLDMTGAKTEWKDSKVNISVKKWDAENLYDLLNTQYSVVIILADIPDNKISQGSGFAVLDGSYIVTNAHVKKDDKTIKVKNFIEEYYNDFTVVLKDEKRDIAVLKGKNNVGSKYVPLKLGDSDKVKIGDGVMAFGFTLGVSNHCPATNGEVIALPVRKGVGYIANTTKTSSGSSGGILMDKNGEVIGVTTAGDDLGHDYSIPINDVRELLSMLH